MFDNLDDELKTWIFKIFLPTLGAISTKLAIMVKDGKATWFNSIFSIVASITVCYVCAPFVMKYATDNSIAPIIAVIALSSDKIAHFFIFKFHVEEYLRGFLDKIFGKK